MPQAPKNPMHKAQKTSIPKTQKTLMPTDKTLKPTKIEDVPSTQNYKASQARDEDKPSPEKCKHKGVELSMIGRMLALNHLFYDIKLLWG